VVVASGSANITPYRNDPCGRAGGGRVHFSLAHYHRISHSGGRPEPPCRALCRHQRAFYQALSLTLAGGFAGLAGTVEVIGVHHRLLEGITSGYGFSGIVAALFGGLHPLGTIPASYLFGSLLVGADKMQRAVQVPSALVDTIMGLVVLFVVGSSYLSHQWSARRLRGSQGAGGHVMDKIFTTVVIVGILSSAIRLATPYLFASIGEAFAQLSGVLDLV